MITMIFDPVPGTDVWKVTLGGARFYATPGNFYKWAGWFAVSLTAHM